MLLPMFIQHFHLQAASKYARQTWEFVNLYSKTRGCNRFLALSASLKFLLLPSGSDGPARGQFRHRSAGRVAGA